jgi:hypothetical protein
MPEPSQLDSWIAGGSLAALDARVVITEGPRPGMPALKVSSESSDQGAVRVPVQLDRPLGQQGAIGLWICPDRTYQNGEGRQRVDHRLMDVPGTAVLDFHQTPAACSLTWRWDSDRVPGVDAMRTNLPELPGGEWYHLLYTWDADRGRFDAYLNGTPQRLPGTAVAPWSMPEPAQLDVLVGAFQQGPVTVEPRYIPPDEAEARDLHGYRGRRSALLGRFGDVLPLDVGERLGDLLYSSQLDTSESAAGWVMEGPGLVTFEDGWMRMASERPDGPEGHIVHWCPEDFPNSYVAEWEIQPVSDYGLCIVFFSAQGARGEDIFDPELSERTGIFSQYTRGDIVSYHVSYYANTPFNPGRTASHLRKNNHFYLVDNGRPGIPPGSTDPHRIRVIKWDSHIQFWVDGEVVIDFTDDGERYGPVHTGGKIGLRQMQWMGAQYRNFRVWELETS